MKRIFLGLILVLTLAVGAMAQGGATPVSITLTEGSDVYTFVSTASANLTNVKPGPGTLYALMLVNPGSSLQYIRLYDKATAPDPSACDGNSDCPVLYSPVPANVSSLGNGFAIPVGPRGIKFENGIGFSMSGAACTVAATCTDETNAAAGVTIIMVYE